MMRSATLARVGVRQDGGRYAVVGELAELVEVGMPLGAVPVGLGLRGLTAAATLAAARGLDLAFVRSDPKRHGTARALDGADTTGRPLVAVIHPDDAALLDTLTVEPELVVFLADAGNQRLAHWSGGLVVPDAQRLDPCDRLEYLEGSFTTSSGRQVSRYVETLPAAFTYEVALEFARRLAPTIAGVDEVCGIAHGGALLAAVAAGSRSGQAASLFHGAHDNGIPVFSGSTCFLDDYIGMGVAARTAYLAVEPSARADSRVVPVFAPVPSVDFGPATAEALIVADPQRPR